jgi:hypothetical protein
MKAEIRFAATALVYFLLGAAAIGGGIVIMAVAFRLTWLAFYAVTLRCIM